MRTCSVCGQNSSWNKHRSYHKFPVNKLQLLEQWVRNIKEADGSWEPSRSSVLCSDHFVRECFNSTGRPRLLANAVPTLFHGVANKKRGDAEGSDDVEVPAEVVSTNSDCNIVISEVWSSSAHVSPHKEPVEREEVVCKVERPSPPSVDESAEEVLPSPSSRGFIYDLKLPSPAWTRHASGSGCVGYALMSIDASADVDPVDVEKLVLFREKLCGDPVGRVFLYGSLTASVKVADREVAEKLLRDADETRACRGVGKRSELKGAETRGTRESGGRVFSEKCEVRCETHSESLQQRCFPCETLRSRPTGRLSEVDGKVPGEIPRKKKSAGRKIARLEESPREAERANAALERALLAKVESQKNEDP